MAKRSYTKVAEEKYLNTLEVKWLNNYYALIEFKKLHKNIVFGVEYKKSYPVLYRWVNRQRELWAIDKLDPDRMEKLNKIKFIWNISDLIWDNFYAQAKVYYGKHGNILMTEKFRRKNKELSIWMNHQRENWLHNKFLTERKIKKLRAIGFNKSNYRDSWKDNFELLKKFHQKHKHFKITPKNKLNIWSIRQRFKKKRGLLSKEHIRELNSIGFLWNIYKVKESIGNR